MLGSLKATLVLLSAEMRFKTILSRTEVCNVNYLSIPNCIDECCAGPGEPTLNRSQQNITVQATHRKSLFERVLNLLEKKRRTHVLLLRLLVDDAKHTFFINGRQGVARGAVCRVHSGLRMKFCRQLYKKCIIFVCFHKKKT